MMMGTLGAMTAGAGQPVQLIFFGNSINSFSPATDQTFDVDTLRVNVNKVVYQCIVLASVILVCGFLQIACWSISASRQAKKLRHAYASAILRQEIGWFDVNEAMQLASRVADTTLLVQEGMGRKVGDGINFFFMGVGGLVLAFYHGWQLSLVLLTLAPVIGISGYCMTKAITSAVQSGVDAYAEAGGIAEESLTNIKTVHMFNAMQSQGDKYMAALRVTERCGIKKGLAVGIGMGVVQLVTCCMYAVAMYYGAVRIVHDQLGDTPCTHHNCYDGGRVITVFFCVGMGSMALGHAGPSIQAFVTARSAAYDIFQLIHRESKIDASSSQGAELRNVAGHLKFENVYFAYPSRPDVVIFRGVSLEVPAGQTIAVVGSSGCGKSTIVSLLERFYDPLSGRVTLDGHDLKALNVKWLRDQIGLVGQEPCLFSDTIAANIRHGKPSATIEEIHEAAKQANAGRPR
ncbi:hypothetical protein H310_08645 [Aphanomyces invadans]|uniref:ABC transmembrane type-1 domain-containing protein n=1 Tax=Aphanomyces invadans TaxID=157072 RepID=A0A024TY05_9STRA|nr:hypothetical protein H310_08645 [Aphanomyces invadans]ETV98506.1 hypothetical protein H310_08645 [Aphanomyces invadans]|eukprot:XP_008872703.1 hypothetical protein H310_08645 [Aphanomyces invadans]